MKPNAFMFFFCLAIAAAAMASLPCAASSLVPPGTEIQDVFQPGVGPVIGRVTEVEGRAVVIHEKGREGYGVHKAMPLYKNDDLITLTDGRIVFMLNDGSVMRVLPATRLQINQSVYSSSRKTRSGLISLTEGRVRFWVTKLATFRDSSFQVRTPTAVMGVRGSDFIVKAAARMSEVIALEDTRLALRGLARLDDDPVIMTDYQRSIIPEDGYPATPTDIALHEIQQIVQDFVFGIDPSRMPPMDDTAAFTGPPAFESVEILVDPVAAFAHIYLPLDVVTADDMDVHRKHRDEFQSRSPEYVPVSIAPEPLPNMPGTPE